MQYKFAVPRPRGFIAQSAQAPAQQPRTEPEVRDIVLHAAICRIAYTDDHNEEFLTKYDPATGTVDVDIPTRWLDYLESVSIGPNLERYFSWLTNSFKNLRRDIIQFTIGASEIGVGLQGVGAYVGYDAEIERIDVLSATPGDLELDLWRVPADEWPGSSAFSITGGSPLVMSGVTKLVDAPLESWDRSVRRGDVIMYDVRSAAGLSLVTVNLYVCKHSTQE